MSLNVIGLVLAAANVWTYPRHYTGAFVLGNLQAAILVRNELFGRLLYLIVNTLFAKVKCHIHLEPRVFTVNLAYSGHHWPSVSLAHQYCSILVVFIQHVPFLGSCGLYLRLFSLRRT